VVLWVHNPATNKDSDGPYGERGQTNAALAGALVRDTFVRPATGWRRIKHEKIVPKRHLQVGSRSLVSPPLQLSLALLATRA
jgi:hypothetical protein